MQLQKYYFICIKNKNLLKVKNDNRVDIVRIIIYKCFSILIINTNNKDIYHYINMFKNEFNISIYYNKKEILCSEELYNYKLNYFTKKYLDLLIINNHFKND